MIWETKRQNRYVYRVAQHISWDMSWITLLFIGVFYAPPICTLYNLVARDYSATRPRYASGGLVKKFRLNIRHCANILPKTLHNIVCIWLLRVS